MKESLIETEGVKYARDLGWLVYKWSAPGVGGILDRIHFKYGICFAIEYKSTGKTATPRQRKVARALNLAGIPCRCCDNVQDAWEFIRAMTEIVDNNGSWAIPAMRDLVNDLTSFDP